MQVTNNKGERDGKMKEPKTIGERAGEKPSPRNADVCELKPAVIYSWSTSFGTHLSNCDVGQQRSIFRVTNGN
jgi:hypothetical protein